jgi:hypothetical protein
VGLLASFAGPSIKSYLNSIKIIELNVRDIVLAKKRKRK